MCHIAQIYWIIYMYIYIGYLIPHLPLWEVIVQEIYSICSSTGLFPKILQTQYSECRIFSGGKDSGVQPSPICASQLNTVLASLELRFSTRETFCLSEDICNDWRHFPIFQMVGDGTGLQLIKGKNFALYSTVDQTPSIPTPPKIIPLQMSTECSKTWWYKAVISACGEADTGRLQF